MEARKILVLIISVVFVGLLVGSVFYTRAYGPIVEQPIKAIVIDTQGAPTIGNPLAKIHIVVFEDFRCPHCADFSLEVFPKIQSEYIDTGKVRYTLIPVAFLPNSKPVANAALEVYAIAPDRFFPYAHELFLKNPMDELELLAAASSIKGIDLQRLQTCLKVHCQYEKLDKNLDIIKKAMGEDFSTPTIYINGIPTPANFRSVNEKIKDFLDKLP